MMNTKTFLSLAIALMMVVTAYAKQGKTDNMVVVAYVTSWTNEVPDPTVMTHINYAFGHVSDSFDAVRIDNPDRLRMIVGLKQQKPSLKVMLSVGGWGSGRFSEMASSEQNRKAFAKDCRRKVDEFGLDGIDIDWEYPTQGGATTRKISRCSCATSVENWERRNSSRRPPCAMRNTSISSRASNIWISSMSWPTTWATHLITTPPYTPPPFQVTSPRRRR